MDVERFIKAMVVAKKNLDRRKRLPPVCYDTVKEMRAYTNAAQESLDALKVLYQLLIVSPRSMVVLDMHVAMCESRVGWLKDTLEEMEKQDAVSHNWEPKKNTRGGGVGLSFGGARA